MPGNGIRLLRRAARLRGRARPRVTHLLIAACCVVFLLSPASGFLPGYGTGHGLYREEAAFFRHWGVLPHALFGGGASALLTPLTALFLHGNWLHLLGNMLFLYVFGELVEGRMRPWPFLVFYLCAGYLAMFCYAAAHPESTETLVGASGAISGVLGAFLYLFPTARVTSVFPFLFFVPLRFPAWLVLLFWLTLQWVAARGDTDGPGVAYLAHVVGFLSGFLFAWLRFRRTRVVPHRSILGDSVHAPDEGTSP
jgi:membrane associated rhomboid family serine protease